ncbi:LOW QUALITY PROTEIN: Endogenous retrovirus group FC1 Env polyprotein [Plecturocebus cupreus]
MCPASSWPPKMISGNPNPWAPLASASPVAPTHHPLTLQSLLLTVLLISPLKANSYVWCFYIQESWVEGPTTRTHYIAQADCQPTGCQSAVIIEIEKTKTKTLQVSSPTPGLCFLYDQKHDYCHWWNTTYGGCPYNSCEIHMPAECHETQNNCKDDNQFTLQGKLFLTIHDPWDDHWVKGVTGKIYNFWLNSHPQGTWLIFQSYTHIVPEVIEQLSSMSHTVLQNEATLTNQFKPLNSTSPPFSWLTLVQQEANMLNLTKTMNITNCFLCASLSNPLLAAVPLRSRSGFNLSQSPTGPYTTLTESPLFKVHSQNFSLCYKTASSSSPSCNTTIKVKSSLYLEVYGQAELLSLLPPSPNHEERRAVLLPMVIGLSLASSLVAARLGSGTLGYSVTSTTELEDKLHVAIEASAASLASLQRQITLLAQQQCCYYINETDLVEENVNTLYCLQEDLRKKQNASVSPLNWWQSPMLTWLTPIITPIIVVFTGPHKGNFQGGRKPDATSPLRPTPNRGTSQLTLPPHSTPTQQEVTRKKRHPVSSKGSECNAGCLAGRLDTPTHLCTWHPPLHSAPTSALGT